MSQKGLISVIVLSVVVILVGGTVYLTTQAEKQIQSIESSNSDPDLDFSVLGVNIPIPKNLLAPLKPLSTKFSPTPSPTPTSTPSSSPTSSPLSSPLSSPQATPSPSPRSSSTPTPTPRSTPTPSPTAPPATSNRTVFAHYYAWYSSSPGWLHWASCAGCNPPGSIYAKYYPTLGPYDSNSDTVLDWHMKWLKFAKIDVAMLSYWGANHPYSSDTTVKKLLNKANEYGLKVAFLLEPGSVEKHKESITHIINNLTNNGTHPGLYKVARQTKYGTNSNPRPLFLFYNWGLHYGNNNPEMSVDQIKALYRGLFDSLRKTSLDGIFLTDNANRVMLLDPSKNPQDANSRSDLNIFHSDGTFSYNPDTIWSGTFAKSNDYINMIQVSPGFDNTKIKGSKVVDRLNGTHYDDSFKEVASQKPEWVIVLTFNEWGENSQIEPANAVSIPGVTYLNYTNHFPGLNCINADAKYLCATANWVDKYKQ